MSIRILDYCPACKHHQEYKEYNISECEMGRHTEHKEAEKNGGLCECQYWEAR